MPTGEELRKAMAARENRKALDREPVAHHISVRESFEDHYRNQMEVLRQKRAKDREAEKIRRKQEEEAARLARMRRADDEREKADRRQTARESAEWRVIANNVVQGVRGLTVARVLEEIEKVQATGFIRRTGRLS